LNSSDQVTPDGGAVGDAVVEVAGEAPLQAAARTLIRITAAALNLQN
jgi:hypothetical protein